MIKKGLLIFISLFSIVFAQYNDDATLFTIADEQVKVKEFIRVYTKNNINNQADFSKHSLEEYLDLYKKFRLKVKEAEALGMDTVKSFINELASYRGQLTPSYLTDRKVTEQLTEEAYARQKEEVNVSHILIFWPKISPSKEDSLNVYNELIAIKKAAEATSFEEQIAKFNKKTKKQYSSKKQKYEGGNLGFISVFQTVYPFENAMYNTPVGTISDPIATGFGYHLVYVKEKRTARGKIETAHILVRSKESDSPENKKIAEEKAKQIYENIKNKSINFEESVSKFSEDKKTKLKAGKLPSLSGSEMYDSYADAAFSLKNDGDISKPVLTNLGWHIIKRIHKEDVLTFDMAKNNLTKRIERDSRSNVAKELMIQDTKTKFNYTSNPNAKDEILNTLANNNNGKELNNELFSIGSTKIFQTDFVKELKQKRSRSNNMNSLKRSYEIFENQTISNYREQHLEEIDVDFKNLMEEYHDGILLFELTNVKVWSKAVEDTVGLKSFFNTNRHKYVWKERLEYTVYTANDSKTASKLEKYLTKEKSKEFILAKINKKEDLLKADTKKEEYGNKSIEDFVWKKGNITKENNLDGSIIVIHIENVLNPSKKELSETRGYVISDYQDFLENKWIDELKIKFPISLNNDVFKTLIKK